MPRPEFELLSTLWDVAAADDDDLAWIMSQLTAEERGSVMAAIEPLGGSANEASEPRFMDALHEASRSAGPPASKTMQLDHLPDWLVLRVLLCIPSGDRRATLRRLPWRRRWSLRRMLWREQANLTLTDQAARTLLRTLRDDPGSVVEGAPA
jgi:hypothetical protein